MTLEVINRLTNPENKTQLTRNMREQPEKA